MHKTANVFNKLPKAVQPKVGEAALHDIWMAEMRENAHKVFDSTLTRFSSKYPRAIDCLAEDRDNMLAFYDFPAEHWVSIRTTNLVESAFAIVRLRTNKTSNCGSIKTTLAMVYKLLQSAQKCWNRLQEFQLLSLEVNNIEFQDGEQVMEQSDRKAT